MGAARERRSTTASKPLPATPSSGRGGGGLPPSPATPSGSSPQAKKALPPTPTKPPPPRPDAPQQQPDNSFQSLHQKFSPQPTLSSTPPSSRPEPPTRPAYLFTSTFTIPAKSLPATPKASTSLLSSSPAASITQPPLQPTPAGTSNKPSTPTTAPSPIPSPPSSQHNTPSFNEASHFFSDSPAMVPQQPPPQIQQAPPPQYNNHIPTFQPFGPTAPFPAGQGGFATTTTPLYSAPPTPTANNGYPPPYQGDPVPQPQLVQTQFFAPQGPPLIPSPPASSERTQSIPFDPFG